MEPGSHGLFSKIRLAFGNPDALFDAAAKEKGIGQAFRYYVVISLLMACFYSIVRVLGWLSMGNALSEYLNLLALLGLEGFAAAGGLIAFTFAEAIVDIAFSFIGIAVIHAFVYVIGGGRGGYGATYKAMIYGATPAILLGWVPVASILVFLRSLYLEIRGLSKLHKITMWRALFAVLAPTLLIVLFILGAAFWAMGSFSPTAGQTKCSPCFYAFSFLNYADGTLILRNGPEETNILKVTGGNMPAKTTYAAGESIIIDGIPTRGDVHIIIEYTSTGGLNHTTMATIHN